MPALAARIRPGDPNWPSAAEWQALAAQLRGRLLQPANRFAACAAAADAACAALLDDTTNPYAVGDDVSLTQAFGWADAWRCEPSRYAVAARDAQDVAAAVRFARAHRLRLVLRGGGHAYQGGSCAPDSLLVWTRAMNAVRLRDDFVPAGAPAGTPPSQAATIGAGAVWADAYHAVTTQAGRYVQGGGCMSVGVAGLVLSGGFGSFSKGFGTASANLLEAQVVTADGAARVVNDYQEPDLFWALRGGGGGCFAAVTAVTLRTHALPEHFGAVSLTIAARTDAAFQRLVALFVDHYAERLNNPHWGEQIRLTLQRELHVAMLFQGLSSGQAKAAWEPFLQRVGADDELSVGFNPVPVVALSARTFWSPALWKRWFGLMKVDTRAGAPSYHAWWSGDGAQVGQFLEAYGSVWLGEGSLAVAERANLARALVDASRQWPVALHFNKGLAGASRSVRDAVRATAINPAVGDAFALVITASAQHHVYPGAVGREPDLQRAHQRRERVARAIARLRELPGAGGSYFAESDYFEKNWQQQFWGGNYPRLAQIKARYDPEGLFFVHHGVGSEAWSGDGFTPRT
ncbi:MAG: hypothetical protein OJF60_003590 [Burkholderiaceae bacterium]|nr:MAG: hypothetical protein OJF60_003590 [Burkholderiaceae bacterium]